jgi:hypothetical protein
MDKGISDFEMIAAIQYQSKRADLAESRLLDRSQINRVRKSITDIIKYKPFLLNK